MRTFFRLEEAGFFPLYVNEINNDALESYLINRDVKYPHLRDKYFSYDIKNLIPDKMFCILIKILKDFQLILKKPIDMVVGGPPCQGYIELKVILVDKKQLIKPSISRYGIFYT